ncbi:MAG: Thymidylate synthase ThyX [Candidatus Anoxychlamydiales bacterium]|nr:Thymidylate synthase ThyX [Candidatus Anoxychlamydiales bacterium]
MDIQEEFSNDEIKLLEKYVTNINKNIFVLKNLPEVIKGALFSRYSRSSLGLRALLLKEFILNQDTSFSDITKNENDSSEQQMRAIQKAQSFYDRILDGFGDDSIGELGGAHLAIENVSMIAAKAIEDFRIGGSPLEKSTRYIYFDQKVNGEYKFYKEPILMTSAYRELYLNTCNMLFDTYNKLIPILTEKIAATFPQKNDISKVAYNAALRAKVLDCLRGLLPSSALTNLGLFGNGRFFETMIKKLHCHNLSELQDIASKSYVELSKIIPSFVRRSEITSKYQVAFCDFFEKMKEDIQNASDNHTKDLLKKENQKVRLINFDKEAVNKVTSALLFENSLGPLEDIQKLTKNLSKEDIDKILDTAAIHRTNRREKSPRALENAYFTFEIVADFGIYRDLQRHRMLTQERQQLNCNLGYYIPKEILNTEMEKDYRKAMDVGKNVFDQISKELPEEAQYIVPMAYNLRWYFTINLRALQWLCELRSQAQGHPNYRFVAQEMANLVIKEFPEFERFFKFVDFEGHDLGRINQEVKRVEKEKSRVGV